MPMAFNSVAQWIATRIANGHSAADHRYEDLDLNDIENRPMRIRPGCQTVDVAHAVGNVLRANGVARQCDPRKHAASPRDVRLVQEPRTRLTNLTLIELFRHAMGRRVRVGAQRPNPPWLAHFADTNAGARSRLRHRRRLRSRLRSHCVNDSGQRVAVDCRHGLLECLSQWQYSRCDTCVPMADRNVKRTDCDRVPMATCNVTNGLLQMFCYTKSDWNWIGMSVTTRSAATLR